MRLAYLDSLKGFLILLVVWGHVVQNAAVDFFSSVSFRTIYSFHMGAFFFVSGIVLRLGRHGIGELPGKIRCLLVPYLSWYLLCYFCRPIPFNDALVSIFSCNSIGLWFLFTLSECIVVCIISEVLAPKQHYEIWMVAIGVILIGLAMLGQNQYVDVRHFAKFYQYFLGGYLMSMHCKWIVSSQRYVDKYNSYSIVLVSVFFVVGLVVAAITSFSGIKFQIYKAIVSWAGCISLVAIFKMLPQRGAVFKMLSATGKMTLGIYAVHVFLMLLFGGYVRSWQLSATFVALLVSSVVIVLAIRRVSIVAMVLLGRY